MYWLFLKLGLTSFNSGILTVMTSSCDSVSKFSNASVFSGQKKFSLQTEFVEVSWSVLIFLFDMLASEVANAWCQISSLSAANVGLRILSSLVGVCFT